MQEPAQNSYVCPPATVESICIPPSTVEVKTECAPTLNQISLNSLGAMPLIDANGCTFPETTLVPIDVATVQPLQIIHTQAGAILTTGTIENGMVVSMTQEEIGNEQISTHQLYGKVWQVIPTVPQCKEEGHAIQLTTQPIEERILDHGESEESQQSDIQQTDQDSGAGKDTLVAILTRPPLKPPPPDAPDWALCLKDCELIGDSYRGWVSTEADLDLLLMNHKHQTKSCWGTRQSTGSHRNSLRLMWKSQYVPYDGIPFINAGSRAIVMECQYGPRRKGGNPWKKVSQSLPEAEFRQTCPARIYIKKVRKFPKFQVNLSMDKKSLRTSMEKAFLDLKSTGFDGHGEDRWYVQLPTENAHEFHDGSPTGRWPQSKKQVKAKAPQIPKEEDCQQNSSGKKLSRIHPHLIDKIRDLVSHGESSVFAIRRQLRKYVEREMFKSNGEVPERHNLCYFPTIHDIQNHIFEALKDIRTGKLPLLVPSVNIEVPNREAKDSLSTQQSSNGGNSQDVWESVETMGVDELEFQPQLQTITVTLTRCNEPGQAPIISKIESHYADGTTKVATTMTQETFDLLSRLHPSIFPPGSLIQIPEGIPVLPAQQSNLEETSNNLGAPSSENMQQTTEAADSLQVMNTEGVPTLFGVEEQV